MKLVKYNSQRDNFDFAGQFKSWQQCFSTSVWMLINYYLGTDPDDKGLIEYIKTVDKSVGQLSKGAENIVNRMNLQGHTSYYWVVQQAGLEDYMKKHNRQGKAVYVENGKWDNFIEEVQSRPVVLATEKLGGLPGGHIILATNVMVDGLGVNDPYGNANTNYKDSDGYNVRYPEKIIRPAIERVQGGIRYMFWDSSMV